MSQPKTINIQPSTDSAFEVEVMRSLRHTAEMAEENRKRVDGSELRVEGWNQLGTRETRPSINQRPSTINRPKKPVIYNPANRD